jgi:N-methylhydantoinase A/oxoprolinase/acetone carboxylase beta subunit
MLSEYAHLFSILGVDIGGTFTDIVYYIPPLTTDSTGQLIVHKVPGTPKNPAQGLLSGMRDLDVARECVIVHGSTVATNALLERKGACTALITTEGFADVLEIGRQDRPALYNIMQVRPPALIPRERRLEFPERAGASYSKSRRTSIAIELPIIHLHQRDSTSLVLAHQVHTPQPLFHLLRSVQQ